MVSRAISSAASREPAVSIMRSVAIRPGWTVLIVTPLADVLLREDLEAGHDARAVGVGELEVRPPARAPHSTGRRRRGLPAALCHPRQQPLQDRHRREDERAVRGLPLLAREAERVLVRRRAAGVGDVDVDRAERGLDAVEQPGDRVEVAGVEHEALPADLLRRGLDHLLRCARPPRRGRPRPRARSRSRGRGHSTRR